MPSATTVLEEELAAEGDGRAAKRQKTSQFDLSNESNELEQSLHPSSRQQYPQRRSRIFAPFRTIGLVSPTAVPFTSIPLGKTTFQITTSVGRALQTYDLRRGLNLVFITRPQTPGPITASLAIADRLIAAWSAPADSVSPQRRQTGAWIFKRGKKIAHLQMPPDLDQDIVQFLSLGSWIIGCCSTKLQVWHAATCQHHLTLSPSDAVQTAGMVLTGGICNLPTYPNKILAGRENGSVEIWNVSTGRLIYTIEPPTAGCGPVTALQPAPALSLVAFAYMDGNVIVQDVVLDKQILKIHAANAAQSPITSISFRTDGLGAGGDGQEQGVLATASFNSGDVTLWDLNNGGKKAGMLRNAHNAPSPASTFDTGGISRVEFLPGQAILVTSGLDNSLKTWIFDQVPFSTIPRILHARTGHAGPITTLNFLPPEADGTETVGKWLLSSSQDRSLWGWSLRRDGQSTELSQGSVQKKAKNSGTLSNAHNKSPHALQDFKAREIICLAASLNRDGGVGALPGVRTLWTSAQRMKGKSTATEQHLTGWESVVTGHEGESFARTWFWGRKRAGRWILETKDGAQVRSVAVSPCGTFALIGSAKGGIDMYNLQSGLHRQRFPAPLTKAQAKKLQASQVNGHNTEPSKAQKKWPRGHGRHTDSVTGLKIDSLNRTVVSCGLDQKVKFWNFSTGDLIAEIDWVGVCTPEQMIFYGQNDLIALACNDSHIRVVDIQTKRTVREITGCKGKIIDFCFSNDGRWIIAASSDMVVRVWDLPTGHMIDAIRLEKPCTALAFSNTGEYLAVAQEDEVGIQLWSNRSLFTHVPTHQISEEDVAVIEGPTASGEGAQNLAVDAANQDQQLDQADPATTLPSIEQLSADVTTLSLVPKSRWQTLLHLDLIRARNKPKEPPKAPESAPFFLPSLHQQQQQQQQQTLPQNGAGLTEPDQPHQAPKPSEPSTRISRLDTSAPTTTFTALLHDAAAADPESTDTFIRHMKTLPPSAADVAIRSLDPAPPYAEYVAFVGAMTAQLERRRDYELVQAWMAVFLRCHGEVLQEAFAERSGDDDDGENQWQGQELFAVVTRWRECQRGERERLGALVGYCAGVVGFLRSAR